MRERERCLGKAIHGGVKNLFSPTESLKHVLLGQSGGD